MKLIVKKFANISTWRNQELAEWLNKLLSNPDPNKRLILNSDQILSIKDRYQVTIKSGSMKDIYKRFNNFQDDIRSHNFNLNYLEWMSTINGESIEWVKSYLTPEKLIGGYCEDFGLYWSIRYNIPLLFLNDEHNLIKYDGKYYDGYDVKGVSKLSDLHYVKTSDLVNRKEDELLNLLRVDEEWKSYNPLRNNIKIIQVIK